MRVKDISVHLIAAVCSKKLHLKKKKRNRGPLLCAVVGLAPRLRHIHDDNVSLIGMSKRRPWGPCTETEPPAAAERGVKAEPGGAALSAACGASVDAERWWVGDGVVREREGERFWAPNPISSIMLSLLQAPMCSAPS